MTDPTRPVVPTYPLPVSALRAPLTARQAGAARTEARQEEPSAEREALAETISAAIARKARQRRYTP